MSNYFIFLDIFIILCLFLSILVSVFRGLKKSLVRFLALLAASILLFVFINPITNKVKDIEVDLSIAEKVVDLPDELVENKQSITSLVNYGIAEILYDGDVDMKENSKTATLILAVSSMVLKISLYIAGLSVVWFLQLIFRLIFKLIIRKEKTSKPILSATIGLCHYLLFFVLVFLPILGTVSLGTQIINDYNSYTNEMEEKPIDLTSIMPYVDQYENTITKKIIMRTGTKLFCKYKDISIDAQYVGHALSFKTDDTTVRFIDEYILIREAAPSIINMVEIFNEIDQTESKTVDLSKLTDEDITNVSNILRNSQLFRAVIPVAIEVSIYNLKESSNDYVEILESLQQLDWDIELTSLANLIDVLKEHNDLKITTNDFNSIITSNGVINLIESFSNKAFELGFITDIMLPLVILSVEDNYIKDEFSEYNIDFSTIKTIDWKNEGPVLISSLLDIYRSYLTLDYKESDIKVLLQNESLPDFINTLFSELSESTIITEKVLPVLMQCLIVKLESNEKYQDLELNFEEFKSINWKANLTSIKQVLMDIVTAYQTLNIDPDNFKVVLKNPDLQYHLDKITDSVLSCDIITIHFLDFVMNKIVDKVSTTSLLQDFEINFEEIKTTDWKEEIEDLSEVFIELLNVYQQSNFSRKEWTKIIDDPNLSKYLNDVVNVSMKSTLIKEHILPTVANKIHSYINENEFSVDLSFVNELITEDTIVDLLNNDINYIVSILRNLKSMNILDGGEFNLTDSNVQEMFIDMIKTIFNLSIINGKEEQVFRNIINIANFESTLETFNITLKYENVTNWTAEINIICDVLKGMMDLAGDVSNFDINTLLKEKQTDENKLAVAELIEDIGNSSLMKDSIYYIIETAIESVSTDYTITFSSESKYYIENVSGWKEETLHLLNLIERIKNISVEENYKDLNAEEIKDIMIYCSECEVTTLVFGTVLSAIFDGILEHDFTNKEVMKQDADVIYNTIKLAEMVQEPTFDLNDAESTKELVDTISNLAQNEESLELTNQLLSNIVDENKEFNYTKDDIEDAANVVKDIIEVYQNSDNQEDFDIEKLPEEDREKVENSELGKLILELFFGK